jgi:hypothetical protein
LTIGRLTVPAAATRLTREGRVNQHQRHARQGCLVGEEEAQLVEGPGVPLVSLLSANRTRFSNSSQVFECQCLARGSGFCDQSLADAMVLVSHVAGLPLAHLLQAAFGRARANPLQSSASGHVAGASGSHLFARELLTLTIRCNVADAQINAEHIVCLSFPGSVFALRDMQEVHPLAPHQFRPSDSPVRVNQHLMLAAPRQQSARNTPGERRERDLIQGQQTVGAGIVADAGAGAELRTTRGFRRREQLLALRLAAAVDLAPFCQPIAFLRPDRLDGLHRLRTGTDRQLREQAEAQAGLTIHAVMGSVGVGDALVPADGRNPGGGFIKATLRLSQDGLVSRGIQLNADGSREHFVHKNVVTDVLIIVKGCAHASVLSSRRLKAGEYPERSFL